MILATLATLILAFAPPPYDATVTDVQTDGDRLVLTVSSQIDVVGDKGRVAAAPCGATVIVRA